MKWAPDGRRFVSASADQTARIYGANAPPQSDVANGGDSARAAFFTCLKVLDFAGAVSAAAFLPAGFGAPAAARGHQRGLGLAGDVLAVAVKGDHALTVVDFSSPHEDCKSATPAYATSSVSLNATPGDRHVSFVVRDLAPSPDGRHLAVATDASRALLLRVLPPPPPPPGAGAAGGGPQPLIAVVHRRHYYGICSRPDFPHKAAFGRGGHYLYVTAADGAVAVFDAGTGRPLPPLPASPGGAAVRDVHAHGDVVAACGFDKAVRLYSVYSC